MPRDETYNIQMKNIVGGINSRFDTAVEKIWELEYIAIETIQNKTYREKRIYKMNRASERWGTTLSSLKYV